MDQYQYADCSKTSVKVHAMPGGNSSFSIGWGNDNVPRQGGRAQVTSAWADTNKSQIQYQQQPAQKQQYQRQPDQQSAWQGTSEKTSVKVSNQPGGNQQFNIFGGQDQGDSRLNANQKSYGQQQNAWSNERNYEKQPEPQVKWPSSSGGSRGQQYPAAQKQSYGGASNNYPPPKQQQSQQYQDRDLYNNQRSQQYPPPREQNYPPPREQNYPPPREQNYPAPRQQNYPPRQEQNYPPRQAQEQSFGQRVESGSNSGPTSGVSSIKLHQPPGGRSQISFQ